MYVDLAMRPTMCTLAILSFLISLYLRLLSTFISIVHLYYVYVIDLNVTMLIQIYIDDYDISCFNMSILIPTETKNSKMV